MWNAAILLASVRSRRLQRVQRHPQTSHAPLLRAPSVRTRVAVSSTSAAHPHPRTAAPGDRLSRPHCLGLRPPRLSLVTLQGSPGEAWDTAPPRQTAPGGSLHFTGLKIVVRLERIGHPGIHVLHTRTSYSTRRRFQFIDSLTARPPAPAFANSRPVHSYRAYNCSAEAHSRLGDPEGRRRPSLTVTLRRFV